jgi:hypothetical protein
VDTIMLVKQMKKRTRGDGDGTVNVNDYMSIGA